MAKEQVSKGTIIARIEAQTELNAGIASAMLGIGAIAMVLALFFEGSAIRLAAWGAIWTGWNVIWGISALSRRETNYIIYRDTDHPSD